MFKLTRDLCFFDIESTGLDLLKDRIVQLALIIYPADGGKPKEHNLLFNPEMPIPKVVTDIHGITDEMVKDKPTFKEQAPWLYMLMKDADLAGYNSNRFDVPMLIEEFHRADLEFSLDKKRLIDVQTIFHKLEPRTLSAAYRFYCGKPMENAHDALYDVRATVDILKGQLDKYAGTKVETEDGKLVDSPIKNDMDVLHSFINDPGKMDSTNRFKRMPDGVVVFNFGKHQNQPVINHEQYLRWMLDSEFTAEVKGICKDLLRKMGRKV